MTILYQHFAPSEPVESGIMLSNTGTFTAYAQVTFSEAEGDVQRLAEDVTFMREDDRIHVMRGLASQLQRVYLDRKAQEAEKRHATAVVAELTRLGSIAHG